ncbi:helix-turn-helix domain-containing protein [Saccharopolyspora hirsuta]|uniref:Helix-turn-helix domain-containing protein n=1 Tax=Saccharopolyspora hirsuta TaxID=1837 RepID=A0A5M7B7V2_SACHI|nr:helix-turn-helix domain-containing protein [Saccharopolyspora hirsuta]KAA5825419.1 helix-turn-helix domain-containing protein [Saccharopolyspora hirsuta]
MSHQEKTRNPASEKHAETHHGDTTSSSLIVQLHTPAEAARQLAVKESWLRRKASRRDIPCTFLGKHLRFSDADLHEIIRQSRIPASGPTHRR